MQQLNFSQVDLMTWLTVMVGVYAALPVEEKEKLHEWEARNLDGHSVGTSDWPGWKNYIGSPPSPSKESRQMLRGGFVYLLRSSAGRCKIGHSTDVRKRLQAFAADPPYSLLHTIVADDRIDAEKKLHRQFSDKRVHGEWFSLDQDDIERIRGFRQFKNGVFLSSSGA